MTYATGEARLDRLKIGRLLILCFPSSGSSYGLPVDLIFGSNYFKKKKSRNNQNSAAWERSHEILKN